MYNSSLYRLGYVANKKRTLKTDGAKYNHFFAGTFKNKRILVNKNPSTEDTIAEVDKVSGECTYQVKPLARFLNRASIVLTLNVIWQFCYDYIDYQEDKDEEVREPIAIWAQKRADCDCYATFISSILRCLSIDHYTCTVKMYNKSNFQHIYILVPINAKTFNPDRDCNDKTKYYILDPVVDSFNLEPEKITFKLLNKMGAELYRISGTSNDTIKTFNPASKNISNSTTLTFGNEFVGFGASLSDNKEFIQGLGCTADKSLAQAQLLHDEFVQRLKVKLVNTRNRLSQTQFTGKQAILEDYDRVIGTWDNEVLRKLEYQKLDGTLGNKVTDKLNQAKNWAKEQADKVASEAKRALEEAQRAADELAKKVKEGAAAVKTKAEQFIDFLAKINPIGIAGRETVFNVFRNNTGGSASRMKWAYAPAEIFVLNGQPISNQAKYKEKLSDIQKIIKVMGGTEMELQSAILAGSSLPSKPTLAYNGAFPIEDLDRQQILSEMAKLLEGEKTTSENSTTVSVVNTGTGVNTQTPVSIAPNAGYTVISATNNVAPISPAIRVATIITPTYARPISAPVSPFVSNGGVYTISNATQLTPNNPVYSVQSGSLSGIDDSIKDIINKIWDFIKELGDDVGQFVKDLWDKIYQGIKVVGLALPRAFFLLLMKLNVDGIATAINLNSQKFEDDWVHLFGGQRPDFKNTLASGAKKSAMKTKLLTPLASYLTKQASIKGLGNPEDTVVNYDVPDSDPTTDTNSDTGSGNTTKQTAEDAAKAAAAAYITAKQDNADLKKTLVGICTAVGAIIGAACGGYGAIIGAPVGAAVGGLIATIIGKPKEPTGNGDILPEENSTTTEVINNSDGTTTTVTKDSTGKVVDSETKDKEGKIIPPPAKKSNALAWIAGLAISAKLLFATGALGSIEEDTTSGIKPNAPTNDLSGTRIKQITI